MDGILSRDTGTQLLQVSLCFSISVGVNEKDALHTGQAKLRRKALASAVCVAASEGEGSASFPLLSAPSVGPAADVSALDLVL